MQLEPETELAEHLTTNLFGDTGRTDRANHQPTKCQALNPSSIAVLTFLVFNWIIGSVASISARDGFQILPFTSCI